MFRVRSFHNAFIIKFLSKRARFSTKPKIEDVISEEPIKYSVSAAGKYKTKLTTTREPRLWYEPHVLLTSIALFLIYFTVLREENDIDQELNRSLYSRIAGLEEQQLQLTLEYNQNNGLETKAIIERLNEIETEKKKYH